MKNVTNLILTTALLLTSLTFTQCSKDDPKPTQITGNVTDIVSGTALADVSVIVFDAITNSPVITAATNSSGDYTASVAAGTYFLKFYKQGYLAIPFPGSGAVSFSVANGQTVDQPAQMTPSAVTDAGYINGKVSVGSTGKSGVLVVAEGTGVAYSGVSDSDGNYSIFNVPAGSYQVKGYLLNYSGASVAANVAASTATDNINVTLTEGVSGQVTGTFKVISQTTILVPPATMDIALVHYLTNETIPGLSQSLTYSSSINFTFSQVPDGDYVIRATYANDYIVIDPDYITKFGDYEVSLSGGVPTPSPLDIVATSAVLLNSPTNEMTSIIPVETTSTPVFSWSAYASTSDYIIEVTDAATGAIVWGGFSDNGTTKNITIPSNTTSVTYNSDGLASIAQLTTGKTYRWRVYASKNDQNSATGWTLIAASEDQMGLIKIQ